MDSIVRNTMGYYYLFEIHLWAKLEELARQYDWTGRIDKSDGPFGEPVDEQTLQGFLSALQRAYTDLPNTSAGPKMVLVSGKAPTQQVVQQTIANWWNQKSVLVEAMGSTKPWMSFTEPKDIILCKPDQLDMKAMPGIIGLYAEYDEVGAISLNTGLPVRDLFSGTWKAKLTNFRDFCRVGGVKIMRHVV